MEAPPRKPWPLLVAIIVAWLFGVGGCTEGSQIIAGYWSPAPDFGEIAAKGSTDEERAAVRAAGERCLAATDGARRRVFPFGVATFVLGAAMVVFSARAMAGRKSARSLLIQLLVVQALFVGVREYATRDLKRECMDITFAAVRLGMKDKDRPPAITSGDVPSGLLDAGVMVAIALRSLAAGLVVLALTRPRSVAWFDAMEARRLPPGGAG
ncbi:MAG: hypothetical protein U0235_20785 [Polyangiaceae bacterium]